ncbi:hypothetical protein JTB14_037745 [Gonioctena quinquepunctata]|nr:hypothetical protein JTB14_037745 [Gonioctena quinquepunctata]
MVFGPFPSPNFSDFSDLCINRYPVEINRWQPNIRILLLCNEICTYGYTAVLLQQKQVSKEFYSYAGRSCLDKFTEPVCKIPGRGTPHFRVPTGCFVDQRRRGGVCPD